jgi:hypothetical protein
VQPIDRPIVVQHFTTFVLAVGTVATQISVAFTKVDLIDSFAISLDAGAANNVFIGDQGVTVNSGLEIVAGGGPINFVIRNQRQHYELQEPAIAAAETLQCQPITPRAIPFVVWDLSQVYLVAAAATNVRIAPFRSMFI